MAALTILLAPGLMALAKSAPTDGQYVMYVGTYTGPASKGVYGFRYDARSGQFTSLGVMAEVANPSWVTTDPRQRVLYASTEANSGDSTISAYAIDAKSGALTLLNTASTGGSAAAQVSVDRTGRIIFVNNYGGGSVAALALNADGSLGRRVGFDQHTGSSVNPRRQTAPHPHAVTISPDNRFLFTPDLGLDKVFSYRIDAAARTFTPNDPAFVTVAPGMGPRHMAFSPNGKFAYVLCEMGSAVAAFAYDRAKGALTPIQTISTLPEGFKGADTSAEIALTASGRFLYASNRGDDSITEFHVEPDTGRLDKIAVTPTGGKGPRAFMIDPTGTRLLAADQTTNDIAVFAIDAETGALTPTGQVLNVPSPVALIFAPIKR
ncbi:MAG TPA: lactonase family protein [Caulobacteraceae bacterium]|nr:lactonase family protein [Caulobacteraceae bacterium]